MGMSCCKGTRNSSNVFGEYVFIEHCKPNYYKLSSTGNMKGLEAYEKVYCFIDSEDHYRLLHDIIKEQAHYVVDPSKWFKAEKHVIDRVLDIFEFDLNLSGTKYTTKLIL